MNAWGPEDAWRGLCKLIQGYGEQPAMKECQAAIDVVSVPGGYQDVAYSYPITLDSTNRNPGPCRGLTPLMMCAALRGNRLEVSQYLLEKRASVNQQSYPGGLTPLMLAVDSVNWPKDKEAAIEPILLKKLIDASADIRIADSEGLTAMDYAIRSSRGLKGFGDILELLLTAIDKDAISPELSAHFENQVRQYQASAQDKPVENPDDAVDADVQKDLKQEILPTKTGDMPGLGKVIKAFMKWDANGDGTVSLNELITIFQRLRPELTTKQILKLFEQLDKNGNGVIEIEEFFAWLQERPV